MIAPEEAQLRHVSCVTLSETVHFNQSSKVILPCVIQNPNVEEGDYIFTPNNEKLSMKNMVAAHLVVSVDQNSCVPIQIVCFDGNSTIYKGTNLGTISKLTDVENMRSLQLDGPKESELSLVDFLKFHVDQGINRSEQNTKLMTDILTEYFDIFSKHKMDLGYSNVTEHHIDTGQHAPVQIRPRRVPLAVENKVSDLIKGLEAQGIIRKSESPWNAPIVVVKKPNGDIRMFIDYRSLNNITKKEVFPIPDANMSFDYLSGASVFSTLDLSQGYYQVALSPTDMKKTAFCTKYGHYEFTRLPFGLNGAPSTFQKLMNRILQEENWISCLVYLDDVLIYGKTHEQHADRLRQVLQKIKIAGLKLNPYKCTFMQSEVNYLGHTISSTGIKTDPKKIEKVLNWPLPRCEEELVSFLGLCGYYRKFIDHYSELIAPLENICKKGTKHKIINWNDEAVNHFTKLKNALTSAPVLAYPTDNGYYILDTDASHGSIGAVLSQIQDGHERVIAFASHKLSKSEMAYCTTRKELYAVYRFVLQFKHYLYGRKFTVRTDHRALTWFLGWTNPNTSQYCRWRTELDVFDMLVEYRKGVEHANADSLSRIATCEQCEILHPNPKKRRNVKIINKDKQCDELLICKMRIMESNGWNQMEDDILSKIILELRKPQNFQKIPESVKTSREGMNLWHTRDRLKIINNQLFFKCNEKYLFVVPQVKRSEIVLNYHRKLGHIGTTKCLAALRNEFFGQI